MPPFAGQGMCSGMRDAANLAWKLDLVLAGKSPPALLDTYASERVEQVAAVIAFSMELGKVICIADADEAAARDAMMTAAMAAGQQAATPPPVSIGPGVRLEGDPCAGQLFVQGRVALAGRSGLFDDEVGRGWTLVSPHGDPRGALDGETAALFAELGGTSAHVGRDAPVRDVDGVYERWFAEHGAAVVLQRPDFYLFGAAPRLADAPALVRALGSALGLR
jgi:3-(3-hydroxy-phenyl)propionate hydroxylase